jgi:hypothetical protein
MFSTHGGLGSNPSTKKKTHTHKEKNHEFYLMVMPSQIFGHKFLKSVSYYC